MPKWPQIDPVFQDEVAKAFSGDETVQQALTAQRSRLTASSGSDLLDRPPGA